MGRTIVCIVVFVVVGCNSGRGASDDDPSLARVPAAAVAALRRQAAGADLEHLEIETDHGVALYEAAWRVAGTWHEATVTDDGEVVELEQAIAIAAVPARVRAAAAKQLGAGAMLHYTRKVWIRYEAAAQVDDADVEVILTATGRVTADEASDGDGDDDGDPDAPGEP